MNGAYTQIVPVHKSDDKAQVTNYHPLSLLCTTSKVVYSKIISYLSSFLSSYQFGFLKNRSVVQQPLLVFNTIFSTNNHTDVVYLDWRPLTVFPIKNFYLSLVFLVDFGCGLNLIYSTVISVWRSITVYPIIYQSYQVSHKAVYLAPYYFLST